MAYALGVGQSDRREQNNGTPSQASGLTTSSASTNTAAGGQAPSAVNSGALEKRVGSTQSPGVSNTSSKSADDFTKTNAANTSAIVDRNQNVDQSGITNKITTDAQNQANNQISGINKNVADYNTAQTAKTGTYAVGPSTTDIQGAVNGDTTSTANVQKALNLQPGQVDSFNAGTYDPIKADEYLKNGDISSVLMNRGSPNYTSGMAALDNLMFGKSGGFQQVGNKVDNLQSQVQNAYTGATDATTGAQATAQNNRNAAVQGVVGKARTGLSDAEQGILSNAATQAQAGNAAQTQGLDTQKAALRTQATQSINNQVADIQKQMQADPSLAASGNAAIAKLQASNPDQFINYNVANNTQDNYLTGDNANSLNRIHQLLGIGGPVVQAGTANQGSTSLRSQDLNDYLAQVMNPVNSASVASQQAKANQLPAPGSLKTYSSPEEKAAQDAALKKQQEDDSGMGIVYGAGDALANLGQGAAGFAKRMFHF